MTLFRSLSFRLALVYVGLFAGSLVLLLGAFYFASIQMPMDQAGERVSREARALATTYMVDGETALAGALSRRAAAIDRRKAFHAFIGPDGRPVSTNLPSWPPWRGNGWLRIEADIYLDGDEEDHDALVLDRRFDNGARLLVGRDIEDIDERQEALIDSAAWVLAVAIFLGFVGGLLMSRAIGRRIDAIASTARRVMEGELSERVPVRGARDDFDRLAETLNLMLARIEELFASVRRVSDSIAHELRTPLARLQADLEDLVGAKGSQRSKLLQQAIDETVRLGSVFDALLRITRIESRRHVVDLRPVDFTKLIEDAVELYLPEAEAKHIAVSTDISPALRLEGDPNLLFQALSNLLDNAVKYTPEGGMIRVAARPGADELIVRIADSGPGIAPEHRGRVTERFYRAPEVAANPGLGLGLSLVGAVSTFHQAQLSFLGVKGGLVVEWRLPVRTGSMAVAG